jgi:hypothetical protein
VGLRKPVRKGWGRGTWPCGAASCVKRHKRRTQGHVAAVEVVVEACRARAGARAMRLLTSQREAVLGVLGPIALGSFLPN